MLILSNLPLWLIVLFWLWSAVCCLSYLWAQQCLNSGCLWLLLKIQIICKIKSSIWHYIIINQREINRKREIFYGKKQYFGKERGLGTKTLCDKRQGWPSKKRPKQHWIMNSHLPIVQEKCLMSKWWWLMTHIPYCCW